MFITLDESFYSAATHPQAIRILVSLYRKPAIYHARKPMPEPMAPKDLCHQLVALLLPSGLSISFPLDNLGSLYPYFLTIVIAAHLA